MAGGLAGLASGAKGFGEVAAEGKKTWGIRWALRLFQGTRRKARTAPGQSVCEARGVRRYTAAPSLPPLFPPSLPPSLTASLPPYLPPRDPARPSSAAVNSPPPFPTLPHSLPTPSAPQRTLRDTSLPNIHPAPEISLLETVHSPNSSSLNLCKL